MGIDLPAVRQKYSRAPNRQRRSTQLADRLDPRRGFKSQSYREVTYFDPSRNLGHHQIMDWTDVLQKQPSEIITLDGYLYARTREGVFRTKMPVTTGQKAVSDDTSVRTRKRREYIPLSERMRKELTEKYGSPGLDRLNRIKRQVYEVADVRRLQSNDGFSVLFGLLKGLHKDQIDYINFMGGLSAQIEHSLYEIKDTAARLQALRRASAQIQEFERHLSPAKREDCQDYLAELTMCIVQVWNNPKDDPNLKWLSQ